MLMLKLSGTQLLHQLQFEAMSDGIQRHAQAIVSEATIICSLANTTDQSALKGLHTFNKAYRHPSLLHHFDPCAVCARRLKARRDQEEEVLAVQASDEDEESSSGEYETDSEEEGLGRQMLKPTFTRKQDRETIAERERQDEQEEQAYQKQQQRLEDRKVETRQIVNEQVAVSCSW